MRDLVPRGPLVGPHRAQGVEELREGRGQGHPQGDVEDGHLDGRVVHRRAGLRGDRAQPGRSSTSTSPAPRRRLGGVGLDVIAAEVAARHERRVPGPARGARAPRARRSAASTSGGARASTTSSTRTPCSSCSTRRAPSRYDIFKEYTTTGRRPGASARDAARPVRAARRRAPAGADRRGRAGLRDRQAVLDRRDELRLDLARKRTRRSRSR